MSYHTTKKGYRRNNTTGKFEHVEIWERLYGRSVPPGYQVHHKNNTKGDNNPTNLELVDFVTHKRLHSGCELRDGVWWKPCSICRDLKPVTSEHWYFSLEGWPRYGRCRPCHIKQVVKQKRLRKSRRKQPLSPQ